MAQRKITSKTTTKATAKATENATGKQPAKAAEATPAQNIITVRPPQYDFAIFEPKWRERWAASGIYQTSLRHAPRPYYNLMMFPYPSAEG